MKNNVNLSKITEGVSLERYQMITYAFFFRHCRVFFHTQNNDEFWNGVFL